MPRDRDEHSDPATASVSTAAAAALLEARLRMLPMKTVSDTLRLLRRTPLLPLKLRTAKEAARRPAERLPRATRPGSGPEHCERCQ